MLRRTSGSRCDLGRTHRGSYCRSASDVAPGWRPLVHGGSGTAFPAVPPSSAVREDPTPALLALFKTKFVSCQQSCFYVIYNKVVSWHVVSHPQTYTYFLYLWSHPPFNVNLIICSRIFTFEGVIMLKIFLSNDCFTRWCIATWP